MVRRSDQRGFTIIEVMLFLAITGLMMAGVLAAITGTVNRQRYDDAVGSFTDYMQGQYNIVDNVRSNRPNTASCTSGSITDGGVAEPRGTSDCSLIGRYVTTSDGKVLSSRPVFATVDVTTVDRGMSEEDYIAALQLSLAPEGILTDDDDQYTIAWGTYVYTEGNQSNRDYSMLVLRLPSSGLIRTYISNDDNAPISTIVSDALGGAAASDEPTYVCVATDGLVSSPPLGVKLLPLAANVAGVQPITGQESRDGGCS